METHLYQHIGLFRLHRHFFLAGFLLLCFIFSWNNTHGQEPAPDSVAIEARADSLSSFLPDSLFSDTLALPADTLFPDTLAMDSSASEKPAGSNDSDEMLSAPVKYKAKDSIRFEVATRKVYLYEEADIKYEDISLKSSLVDINFSDNTVFAEGKMDTLGKLLGTPVFEEGGQVFESETMRYNFKSKKGIIQKVITEDGQGYLHGNRIKKMPNDDVNIKIGKYTTCNHKHPHYEFRFQKAKVIPGKKIVTGPAYLVIADVPTPLYIPFGIFPNKTGQRSGIIIPSYGESSNRGFFFENGGYYWAINDRMDLTMTGDIYTRGSWALEPEFRYRKRYKYNGTLRLAYAFNRIGEEGASNFQEDKGFSIYWSHRQDAKARPNSSFSASVNISSNSFNKYNPVSTNNYLSNTFQSSVAYQTNFDQKFFLTLNSSYTQNTLDRSVRLTLPQLNFNTNTFYPFKKKNREGKEKWYERVSVKYSMNAQNTINTYDTLLFDQDFAKRMKNGMKHDIPISSSIKVLKYFNLSNSIRYTERWYSSTIRKYWVDESIIGEDTTAGYVQKDTVYGFSANRDFSYTTSLNTRIYGMFSLLKGPIKAIRLVHNPSLSFTYHPDFADPFWGAYYKYRTDEEGTEDYYSIYEDGIYGGPPEGVMGRVSFSLSNNLEMKVRSRKDTVTGTKKIKLIENFTVSMSYDMAKDSLNWSPLSMSGRTTLFKNLQITYRSSWDPYILDSAGTKNLNKFEWDVNHRLFRLENTSWNVGLNFRLSSKDFKKKDDKEAKSKDKMPGKPKNASQAEIDQIELYPERYVDWSIPWNLNVRYSLGYTATHSYPNYVHEKESNLVQTLSFSGDFSVTPKWKVTFRSGYDFENNELTYTSINIIRDLHCWEMSFNWIPMGFRKQWNFQINVKSSILQDLKLTKKKDWRDF